MSIKLDIVNKTTSLVAKRNSGKSVLLKYLVQNSRSKFSKIFVVCPTESVNSFYSDLVEESCIFDSWNEQWADALIQKMTTQNANKSKEEKKNILIILDDVMSDTNFGQSPALKSYTHEVDTSILLLLQRVNICIIYHLFVGRTQIGVLSAR